MRPATHQINLLLVFLVAGCATVASPMGTDIDISTMTADTVLQLVQPGAQQQVYNSESFHDAWEEGCLERNDYCSGVDRGQWSESDFGGKYWPMRMKQLFIGCANEGSTSTSKLNQNDVGYKNGEGSCFLLAEQFVIAGNMDAARAIIFHAPGCKSIDESGERLYKCNIFGTSRAKTFLNKSGTSTFSAAELFSLARDALSYDPSDEIAASYLVNHGIHIDLAAVQQLHQEAHASAKEASLDRYHHEMEQDAVHQARVNAIMNALRDAGGGDQTAILDAASQQTAAIRAIGNANSVRTRSIRQSTITTPSTVPNTVILPPTATASTAGTSMSMTGTQTTPSVHYLPPLPGSCIRSFPDPHYYNWLSLQNTCNQSIYVSYIYRKPTGWAMGGGMTLAPGAHKNTGNSAAEVNNAGGMLLYICPANSVPVDGNGHVFFKNVSQYKCNPQG